MMTMIERKKNPVFTKKFGTLLLLLCFAFGCGSARVKAPGESSQVYVFPYGKYQHDVHLSIAGKNGEKPQEYHFNGVVQIGSDKIQVVGLSAFGTTVFKITDHLDTGKVEDEIYVQPLKAREEKILAFYQLMKKMLILKKDPNFREGSQIPLDPETQLIFGAFDANHIPKTMQLHSSHFDVQVEVTRHDF